MFKKKKLGSVPINKNVHYFSVVTSHLHEVFCTHWLGISTKGFGNLDIHSLNRHKPGRKCGVSAVDL